MDDNAQKQVMATLYDRLFEAISYDPNSGRAQKITPENTRVMMAKNRVLDPKDFANALSPLNPGKTANAIGAKAFSDMVDVLPGLDDVEWIGTGQALSDAYTQIVNGANTDNAVDPKQKATYDKAYSYLNTETKIANFDGSETVSFGPSRIAQAYNDNQTAYFTAASGYQVAYNGYDLSKPEDQRAWNAVEPMLGNAVQQAWNKWVREGKANVEQAQQALATTINDAVSSAILAAQTSVSDSHRQAPLSGDTRWLLSYGMPSAWMDPKLPASKLEVNSTRLLQTASAEATSYQAKAQGSWGLWSAGGSTSYSEEKSRESMQASNFSMTAELIQVTIARPWYNPLIFTMKDWWVKGYGAGGVSNGPMPWVPTSFVVARNVTIKSDFSSSDKEHFSSQRQASVSVGWGPFAVSGSYSHSESKDRFESKFDSGGLHLPGLQVVAVICSRTPLSPPMDAKK